jgi:hypothetical protein
MRHTRNALLSLIGGLLLATNSWADADLNAVERKWLDAATPVLDFAREQGLPVDVVVVTDRNANDVPLSMGVRQRRCKLVLAVRGDTEAEATLNGIPLERHAMLIEAMTAHEIAHCWRYVQGEWHKVPAAFIEPAEVVVSKELRAKKSEMRATRREEGFADLVALAWTLRQRPESYAEVHTWLEGVRHHQPVNRGFHDTRVWLELAKHQHAFRALGSPFEQVDELWAKGLDKED